MYRLNPKNKNEIFDLAKFGNNSGIDFWSPLTLTEEAVDVMVHPKAQAMFTRELKWSQIQYNILITDVKTIVERGYTIQRKLLPSGKVSFEQYCRFQQINSYLDQLAIDYSNIVTVKLIGKSYQKRKMKVIQISSNPDANKPIVFIDAGMHAREWIAPAMSLYIINQLVENATNSYLLDKVDWYILPVVNPDGYEYSHKYDRFWRKTVAPHKYCFGTDANRNFGFHWGEDNASNNFCSETYRGPFAFSEIETQNLKAYIENWRQNIKLYLSLHSYGNYIFYPWGYTYELPQDHSELHNLAENVNAAIVNAGGNAYKISSSNVLYLVSGGSYDWIKGSAGIQLAFTIELPKGKIDFFHPGGQEIFPIVRETFPGIRAYGEYVAKKFGT